jgi:DNA invertase Pin-like site-specific DNA recombinase
MTSAKVTSTWYSQKILPQHLERLAVVYVRQSTVQQVLDHQESTRLQYGLVERAEAWGWHQERILVIDDDLGKSGASSTGRVGFGRLVAEVGMGHVGLILGIEMSRLARSCKDWHQLLEICALFGTLIADLDGVYDPSQYNDRLLLGLKGTMSEAELHLLRQRMSQGRISKAQRGALNFPVPTGYVRRASGEVVFDPDEQVQQVTRLIFRKFEELGTVHAVLRYLVEHHIEIGIRVRTGECKGDLEWHRPNRVSLQNTLKNPIYAGAYAYGRRQGIPVKGSASGSRIQKKAMEDWHVLIQDQVPAYISWEQYQRNQRQLQANRRGAESVGAAQAGNGLLVGLLVCGKCGCRMSIHYQAQGHRYQCGRQATDYGGVSCQGISGESLDQAVVSFALQALSPASIELSLAALTQLEQEHQDLTVMWQQRLERAKYEAERAQRHYQFVEPENRLVARQLAQEWEAKLRIQQQLQEEYERFCQQQRKEISEDEREAIRQLADHIPGLWNASTTTNAQRKEILRQILVRVMVNVKDESEFAQLRLEWVGGTCSETQIQRPVAKLTQLSNYSQLCTRVRELVAKGWRAQEIAQQLNQEGFYPPKRRSTFNAEQIQSLVRNLGLQTTRSQRTKEELPVHEWWLTGLAQALSMPTVTLYSWIRAGWVKAKQQEHPPRQWIIWADEAELERLRQLRTQSTGQHNRQHFLERVRKASLNDDEVENKNE